MQVAEILGMILLLLAFLHLSYLLFRARTYETQRIGRKHRKSRGGYGYIYFYSPKHTLVPIIKIGRAKDVIQRLKAQRTALPFGMKVHAVVLVRNDVKAESYVHNKFKAERILSNNKNEWFWLTPRILLFMWGVKDHRITQVVRKEVEWLS